MIKDYTFTYYAILAGIIHIITILPLTMRVQNTIIPNKMSLILISYLPVN